VKVWKLAISTMALVLSAVAPAATSAGSPRPTGTPRIVAVGGDCAEYMCGTNHNEVLV
jgi:hypothetical protein